jgi:hypothetical protein
MVPGGSCALATLTNVPIEATESRVMRNFFTGTRFTTTSQRHARRMCPGGFYFAIFSFLAFLSLTLRFGK